MKTIKASLMMAGLLLVSPIGRAAPTDSPGEIFLQAQHAYDRGDYQTALAHFDSLARDYPRRAELHFNRGNTLARLGRVGDAIAAYEQARLLRPRDADVQANLKFVREHAGLPAPRSTFGDRLAGLLSYYEWKRLSATLWWAFCAAWVLYFMATGKRASIRRLGSVAGGLLLAALMGLAYTWNAARKPIVVVNAKGAKALFAPIETAVPHFDAPEGLTGRLLQDNGAWVEVRSNGRNGWLPRKDVHIVRLDGSGEIE